MAYILNMYRIVSYCDIMWAFGRRSIHLTFVNFVRKNRIAFVEAFATHSTEVGGMKLKPSVILMSLIYFSMLLINVWAFENVDFHRMSMVSAKRANTTAFARHKRYLDFIPKSRMFVSSLIWSSSTVFVYFNCGILYMYFHWIEHRTNISSIEPMLKQTYCLAINY